MPVYEEKEKINGQKRYYIRAYVNDANGKKKQITKHNKNWIGREGKKEAEIEEARIKGSNFVISKNNKVKLIDLVVEKIEEDKKYLKPSSIIRYNELYNIYIEPYFKNSFVDDLKCLDILNWHNWLDYKKIKIETKKKIHNLLRSGFNFGIKYYDLKDNLCDLVGNFKNRTIEQKREINFLTLEQFEKFISFEKSQYYIDFFTILFFTGMRRGELIALTKNDIDFEKNIIKINKSINLKNGNQPTAPKTKKSNREIPMLDIVSKTLKNILNTRNEIFDLDNIKFSTLTRKCHNNCKSAGISTNIRVHDFRHSFVALCIESGVKIERISEYVGHENISTTYDIYSHLYPNAKNELVYMVQNYVKQDQKQDQKAIYI